MGRIAPAGDIYQAGTLSGNPLAMAAGLATLERLEAPGVYEVLEARTRALVSGLETLAAEAGVAFSASSIGGMFGFFFHPGPVRSFADARRSHAKRFKLFFAAMLEGGIYLAPSAYEAGFMSLAHRQKDVDRTLEIARNALLRSARVR
jgi:glutamate-1-semialdehyde 2,1-aminomutase